MIASTSFSNVIFQSLSYSVYDLKLTVMSMQSHSHCVYRRVYSTVAYVEQNMKCDASSKMSLQSKSMIFFWGGGFWHFLLGYCLDFNLVKIPQRLGN